MKISKGEKAYIIEANREELLTLLCSVGRTNLNKINYHRVYALDLEETDKYLHFVVHEDLKKAWDELAKDNNE